MARHRRVAAFRQGRRFQPLRYNLPLHLIPDSTYRLTIDTLALTSVYGTANKPFTKEFKVRGPEEYANLFFTVNVEDNAFAELLDGTERVVQHVPVTDGGFDMMNVLPGTYYVRLVKDRNGNDRWDTGNYAEHLQPEEVYYYPKRLNLRRNWDVDESWDIFATAIDLQKPHAIKKTAPRPAATSSSARTTRKTATRTKRRTSSTTPDTATTHIAATNIATITTIVSTGDKPNEST